MSHLISFIGCVLCLREHDFSILSLQLTTWTEKGLFGARKFLFARYNPNNYLLQRPAFYCTVWGFKIRKKVENGFAYISEFLKMHFKDKNLLFLPMSKDTNMCKTEQVEERFDLQIFVFLQAQSLSCNF